MDEFLKLRKETLQAEYEKALQQIAELQAVAQRIQGALILIEELRAQEQNGG